MDGCIVEWMGLIILPKRMLEWVDRKVSFDRILREGHIWGAGPEFTTSLLQYVILAQITQFCYCPFAYGRPAVLE